MNKNLEATKTLLECIESYRIKFNKPKDEKIKPLNEWDIQSLPNLPENWGWLTSNEISTFITNGVHSPTSYFDELGINKKMLRITDIDDSGNANYLNLPYCKRFVKGDYDKTIKKNDIYISFTGNILGKKYIVNESRDDIVFAHYFVRWQPIIVNPKYIYYVLLSSYFTNFINAYKLGSTQPNLKVTDLKRVPLPIPPLPTQKKIAHILSTLDDKIELNHKMNQTLEAMASAIFKSWFVDSDPVHAKANCKTDAELESAAKELGISKEILDLFPNEFDESELGMIPKGWELKEFSSLVKHLKPGTNYQPDRVEDGIPFVNGKHIKDGFLDLTDIKYITQDEYDRVHKSWQPEAYDVLITRIGTLGKVGVVMPSDLPLALHYNSINIKAGKLNHQFLYFLLKSDFFQKQFHTNKKQAVQEFITIEAVEQLKILMPNSEKIFEILSGVFDSYFNLIESNTIHIRTLQKTRDTLLPKLLSGEIDVSEMEI